MTAALLSAILLLAARPEHAMNEPLIAALDRALQDDAQVLQGLGVEEAVLSSPSWDDRVAVDGAGRVTFTSKRAAGDRGGAPIGVFQGKLEKDELKALLTALRQISAAPPQPMRAEAYETRVLLSVVAGGHEWTFATKAFPTALEPLQPVLDILGRAQAKAMEHPVRSLALTLEVAGPIAAGPVPLVLHLSNQGEAGVWVSNPLRLPNQKEHERAELVYAKPLVFTPGVTPVPMPPRRTPIVPRTPVADSEPRYRWVPPKGELAVPVQAVIEPPGGATEVVLRAELHLDEGGEIVAGQPRLRGSVFAADVKVPLK
jgi:hypothetical protein